MTRFRKLTLAAALSLGALTALPASAADLVVSLKGKSAEQIKSDLREAAETICQKEKFVTLVGLTTCINAVYDDALQRLPKIGV